MRALVGTIALAHGIAHLPGFFVAWRLHEFPELPYRTTIFAGALNMGDAGMRLIGAAWLGLAIMFLIAGMGLLLRWHCAYHLLYASVALSVLFCASAWPATRMGLSMNGVLAFLLYADQSHFQPAS